MSIDSTLGLKPEIEAYIRSVSLRESPLLEELRLETLKMPEARMQVSAEQGQLLAFLVRLTGARRLLEVGVFTGYSSLSMALALPEDGRLIACDISDTWTARARHFWQRAGVDKKIDLRIAPAIETLEDLLSSGEAGKFDFAFIDADKQSYGQYYEKCLRLLCPGGLMLLDNMLWSGRVLDTGTDDEETLALQELNRRLHHDERVDLSLLPVSDGITFLRKRD